MLLPLLLAWTPKQHDLFGQYSLATFTPGNILLADLGSCTASPAPWPPIHTVTHCCCCCCLASCRPTLLLLLQHAGLTADALQTLRRESKSPNPGPELHSVRVCQLLLQGRRTMCLLCCCQLLLLLVLLEGQHIVCSTERTATNPGLLLLLAARACRAAQQQPPDRELDSPDCGTLNEAESVTPDLLGVLIPW